MVSFVQRMELRYQEEDSILVPKDLISQKLDKTWLQLRPTSQAIIHFLAGTKPGRNASLSSSTTLQNLIKLRNAKVDQPQDQADPADNLFEGEPSPKRKIRRRGCSIMEPHVISIQVQGQDIQCLVAGSRPRASDLIVELPPRLRQWSKSSGLRTLKLPCPRPRGPTRRKP